MRKKVTEPERLDNYLINYGDNNDDFKALVLKLLASCDDVEKVHQLTGVPSATIYSWLAEWNKKRRFASQSTRSQWRTAIIIKKPVDLYDTPVPELHILEFLMSCNSYMHLLLIPLMLMSRIGN